LTLSTAILKNKNPIYPGSPNTETGYPVIANVEDIPLLLVQAVSLNHLLIF